MVHPDMLAVREGEFYQGTSDQHIDKLLETEKWAMEWADDHMFDVEQPFHKLYLPTYSIGRNMVSNYDYYEFITATGYHKPQFWDNFQSPPGKENHPVVGVTYKDCHEYCGWVNKKLSTNFRIPTEAEWEKAARGVDGRIYPWGDIFEEWRCNTVETTRGETSIMGIYAPGGNSPFHIVDVAGNAFEWTSSTLMPYPLMQNQMPEPITTNKHIIIKGGSWYYSSKLARCAARETVLPSYNSFATGFRLAHDGMAIAD